MRKCFEVTLMLFRIAVYAIQQRNLKAGWRFAQGYVMGYRHKIGA